MIGQEKMVLIVEDEYDNREIMRAVVEDILGYRAMMVSDGAAALEAIKQTHPDLILMDLMMPVLDGFETISRLKSTKATASIPVIAVSALGRVADRQRAIECGANDYISKPFDIEKLMEVVEAQVNGELDRQTPTTYD